MLQLVLGPVQKLDIDLLCLMHTVWVEVRWIGDPAYGSHLDVSLYSHSAELKIEEAVVYAEEFSVRTALAGSRFDGVI